MGQHVSVDREGVRFKDFCYNVGKAVPRRSNSFPLRGGIRHHIKAWKFQRRDRAIVDVPAQLSDENGLLNIHFEKCSSYLILHAYVGSTDESQQEEVTYAEELEKLATRAHSSCSPRGLGIQVAHGETSAQGCMAGMVTDEQKGPTLHYEVFLWHGQNMDTSVKSRLLSKAFELENLLKNGLLWHSHALESLQRAVPLKGIASIPVTTNYNTATLTAGSHASNNRLITRVLENEQRAPNPSRYPILGFNVCRALGVSRIHASWGNSGPATPQRSRCAPPPAPAARLAPKDMSVARGPAVASPQQEKVPCLAPGFNTMLNTSSRETTAGGRSMEVDSDFETSYSCDAGGRKRFRVQDSAHPSEESCTLQADNAFQLAGKRPRISGMKSLDLSPVDQQWQATDNRNDPPGTFQP